MRADQLSESVTRLRSGGRHIALQLARAVEGSSLDDPQDRPARCPQDQLRVIMASTAVTMSWSVAATRSCQPGRGRHNRLGAWQALLCIRAVAGGAPSFLLGARLCQVSGSLAWLALLIIARLPRTTLVPSKRTCKPPRGCRRKYDGNMSAARSLYEAQVVKSRRQQDR